MDWNEVMIQATRAGVIWCFWEVARALRLMSQPQLGGDKELLGSLKKVRRQFERIESRISKDNEGKGKKEEENAEPIH